MSVPNLIPYKSLYISDYICSCYAFVFIFDFLKLISKHILQFHASVFLARQPMETGCPYPLNEDDPPVTRLVAMAPACHASPCPSLSPTFIRQHLPDNRMR